MSHGGAALGDLSVDDLVGADPQRTPLRAAVLANCVRVVFLTLGVLGDERAAGATTARSYTSLAGDLRWYIQRIAAERSNIHIAIRVTLIRPRFRGSLDRARAPIL